MRKITIVSKINDVGIDSEIADMVDTHNKLQRHCQDIYQDLCKLSKVYPGFIFEVDEVM